MSSATPLNYPYPDIHGPITSACDSEAQYEEESMRWRKSLSDMDVRALAAEYRMGNTSPENRDGHYEYLARFGDADRTARAASKKRKKRKTK